MSTRTLCSPPLCLYILSLSRCVSLFLSLSPLFLVSFSSVYLSSDEVEVVGGCGGVGHAHIHGRLLSRQRITVAQLHTTTATTAQHSTAQHSTAQHSTAQHSTAQHSTQHTTLHRITRRTTT